MRRWKPPPPKPHTPSLTTPVCHRMFKKPFIKKDDWQERSFWTCQIITSHEHTGAWMSRHGLVCGGSACWAGMCSWSEFHTHYTFLLNVNRGVHFTGGEHYTAQHRLWRASWCEMSTPHNHTLREEKHWHLVNISYREYVYLDNYKQQCDVILFGGRWEHRLTDHQVSLKASSLEKNKKSSGK